MAHQHSVVFIDDIDGSEAAQTVSFSLDGQQYEIDLSAQNIQRLYDALAPYASKARRVRGEPGTLRRPRKPRPVASTARPAAVDAMAPAGPSGSNDGADTGRETTAGGDAAPDAAPEQGNAAPSRRSVPAAVFSDSSGYAPPRPQNVPKPHTNALFSPAG